MLTIIVVFFVAFLILCVILGRTKEEKKRNEELKNLRIKVRIFETAIDLLENEVLKLKSIISKYEKLLKKRRK